MKKLTCTYIFCIRRYYYYLSVDFQLYHNINIYFLYMEGARAIIHGQFVQPVVFKFSSLHVLVRTQAGANERCTLREMEIRSREYVVRAHVSTVALGHSPFFTINSSQSCLCTD